MANTKPARGMRDFLPSDVRKRNYVINIIKEVYESYGFEPLETPSVENLETLTGKYGEEGNQLIFKILKRGEKLQEELSAGAIKNENELSDLALRYDLTVPLARVVANYKNDLPKFFKRYQIQPVWRADRPARGRYREFYQCDVDAIGSSSMIVEAELCAAVSEILERLGFEDFTIRINDRRALTGILIQSGIPIEKHSDALIALDKLDKIGRNGVSKEFGERGILVEAGEKLLSLFESLESQISEEAIELQKKLIYQLSDETSVNLDFESSESHFRNPPQSQTPMEKSLSEMYGIKTEEELELRRKLVEEYPVNSTIKLLKEFIGENELGRNGLNKIKEIVDHTKNTGVRKSIKIDPSLARGLSYYTGAIFEINVPDLAGSLGGGGRYDGLIGMFGKEQIPACGFSLGLERILVVMEERGMFPKELSDASADVMVTVWNADAIGESLKLAAELRSQNLRVLVYPEADKLGKQFKYADSIKVPFVCVLGENELADNKVTLKNLKTGEQNSSARSETAANILAYLKN